MAKRGSSILSAIILLVVVGCSSPPPTSTLSDTMKRAVVFIPGFKGSELRRDDTDSLVWISATNALFNLNSLALPIAELQLANPGLRLHVGKILKNVSLLGGVYTYDIYGASIRNISKSVNGAEVRTFAYDWREPIATSAIKLGKLVNQLHDDGFTDVSIVAHSMGGVVAAYYLRYGEQEIDTAEEKWISPSVVSRVAFVAAPFKGAITIFRDIQEGIQSGLNTSLLDREALSTFPASYQLFPGPDDPAFLDKSLKPISGMYESENWRAFKWGLFGDTKNITAQALEARKNFTARQLAAAALLRKKIESPPTSRREIPILNIVGGDHPTIARAIFDPISGATVFTTRLLGKILPDSKADVLFHDGDSVVPVESALLPDAYRNSGTFDEKVIPADHGSVISGEKTAELIHDFFPH